MRLGGGAIRGGPRPRDSHRRAIIQLDDEALAAVHQDIQLTPVQWVRMARDPHALRRPSENVLSP
jgi:hypothetical protein